MSTKLAFLKELKIRSKSSFYDMIDRLAYMKLGNSDAFSDAGRFHPKSRTDTYHVRGDDVLI